MPNPSKVRAARVMAATAFRADPAASVVQVVLALLNALNVAQVVGLKFLVDAISTRNSGRAIAGAVIIAGLGAVSRAANNLGARFLATLQEKTDLLLDRQIMELTSSVPGVEHYERPDYADELELLRTQRGALSQVIQAIVGGLVLFFRSVITLILLASLHPVLLLLPVFSIPSLWVSAKAQQIVNAAEEETAPRMRLLTHLFTLGTTAAPAKELRIFGLHTEVPGRYAAIWDEVRARLRRAELRSALLSIVGWAAFAIGFVGAITIVAIEAVAGRSGAGDVVLAFTLAGQINAQVAGAAGTVVFMMRSLRVAGRLVWLKDYAEAAIERDRGGAEVPARLVDGIDFEDVSFRYPGTEVDVLAGVNLHIPAGSTVAIVGENGAGKSTLVKLLCRLYEPTSGRILVDGTELSRLPVAAWRERQSAGFQDFARLEFLARETVGVGDLPAIDDVPAVTGALDRASAADVVTVLDDGLETQLGKSFADGAELSGGQWQKLALGRAMMRETPLLLVLDEPTAALDAETEHALFERYAGAARRAAGTSGAITLLVSHRFSTVRMADLILVVNGGRITEAGTHAELMAHRGLYAELYELQARAYR